MGDAPDVRYDPRPVRRFALEETRRHGTGRRRLPKLNRDRTKRPKAEPRRRPYLQVALGIQDTSMRNTILTALVCLSGVVLCERLDARPSNSAAPTAAPITSADGEGWVADFDAAVAQAKREGKDLFVDFTGSDWCTWCIRLDNEVFKHEEFLGAAKAKFVLVALDYPRGEEARAKVPNPQRNQELSQKYEIQGFPTILLMTADGEVFGRTGYRPGGPTPYVEHLNEMLTKGKAEVAAAVKLVAEWNSATGAAKDAAWDKIAMAAEGMSPEGVAAEKLVEPLRAAFTSDADNAQGRKLRATKQLLRLGRADANVIAAAVQLDPKNESALHEQAVEAMFNDREAFDDPAAVKRMVEAVEKLDALGKLHDQQRLVLPFAFSAFLSRDVLSDLPRAKRHAQRVKDIGSDNQRLMDALEEILQS